MVNEKVFLKLLIGIILTCFCIPIDSIDIFISSFINNQVLTDVHYYWFNSLIFAGVYGSSFICILSTVVYSDMFCREYDSGIWRYVIVRTGKLKYVVQGFLKAFFGGGITLCGGGLLFLLMTCPIFPVFDVNRYGEISILPFSHILKTSPGLYFLIMLFLLFLTGGLWSCVSFCFSVYVPVKKMVYLFPFIVRFIMGRIMVIFKIPNEWRFDFMLCGRSGPQNELAYIAIVMIGVLLVVLFCGCLFYKKVKWRIENE